MLHFLTPDVVCVTKLLHMFAVVMAMTAMVDCICGSAEVNPQAAVCHVPVTAGKVTNTEGCSLSPSRDT